MSSSTDARRLLTDRDQRRDTGCCDAILVRDAYHGLTQPEAIARSPSGIALKPGGRLAVIDFPPRPNTEVPEGVPANRLGHGVPPKWCSARCPALTHVQTITSWVPTSQNASLYLLLFRKP